MGYKVVSAGAVIASADMNLAIGQGVLRFSSASQRTTQLPSPSEGMISWLEDLNRLEIYYSSAWRIFGSMRQGNIAFAAKSVAANTSVKLPYASTTGGAAGKPGRATWTTAGDITVPFEGAYLVSARMTWPSNTTGQRRMWITVNDSSSAVSGGMTETNTPGSTTLYQSVTGIAYAAAGAKIAVYCSHSATASLSLAASHGNCGVVSFGGSVY